MGGKPYPKSLGQWFPDPAPRPRPEVSFSPGRPPVGAGPRSGDRGPTSVQILIRGRPVVTSALLEDEPAVHWRVGTGGGIQAPSTKEKTHGCERRAARGAGPRLADRHARRREVPRSPVPPLARRTASITLLHQPGSVVRPSNVWRSTDQLPAAFPRGPSLLPLSAAAHAGRRRGWRLPRCDLVVSFSHCVAKAARPPRGVPHVCYCFTPMRYAWHMRNAYFGGAGGRPEGAARRTAARPAARLGSANGRARHTLRRHQPDRAAAHRRVLRPAQHRHLPAGRYRLLLPRRRCRARIIIWSCRPSHRTSGSTWRSRRASDSAGGWSSSAPARTRADCETLAGPTVHFLGWQPDDVIRDHLRRCRALLFPGEEDFGIVPVEAHGLRRAGDRLRPRRRRETVVPLQPADDRQGCGSRNRRSNASALLSKRSKPGPASWTPTWPAGRLYDSTSSISPRSSSPT